jgi:Mrp family chromosome partitioning ATPase
MSKVYEALQHAHVERNLVVQFEERATPAIEVLAIPVSRGLPPLQMEREMGRLYQNVSPLLSEGVIQFVGSRKREGTSTILHEFGLFLAVRVNKSVLLVDADRSHMSQHQAFGMLPKISLQRIMSESGSVEGALCQVNTSRAFLCLLYEGTGERSQQNFAMNCGDLWNKLRKTFDYVLIDSPPIGASDEALALCSSADGVILVVEAEKTRSRVLSHLKARVAQRGGNILGLVFNKQRYYIPDWIYKRL